MPELVVNGCRRSRPCARFTAIGACVRMKRSPIPASLRSLDRSRAELWDLDLEEESQIGSAGDGVGQNPLGMLSVLLATFAAPAGLPPRNAG